MILDSVLGFRGNVVSCRDHLLDSEILNDATDSDVWHCISGPDRAAGAVGEAAQPRSRPLPTGERPARAPGLPLWAVPNLEGRARPGRWPGARRAPESLVSSCIILGWCSWYKHPTNSTSHLDSEPWYPQYAAIDEQRVDWERAKNEHFPLFIPRATARRGHWHRRGGIRPTVYIRMGKVSWLRLMAIQSYRPGPHPRMLPGRPAARPQPAGEMLKL
jgi:hypothetical protein